MELNPLHAKCCVIWYFILLGVMTGVWAARIPELKVSYELSDGSLGLILLLCNWGNIFSSFDILLQHIVWKQVRCGPRCIHTMWHASGRRVGNQSLCPCLLSLHFRLLSGMRWLINTQASIIEKLTRASLMGSFYRWYSIGGVAGVLSGGLMQSANINIFHSFFIISACCIFLSELISLKLVSRDDIKDIMMITFSLYKTSRVPTSDTASVTKANRMIVSISILAVVFEEKEQIHSLSVIVPYSICFLFG